MQEKNIISEFFFEINLYLEKLKYGENVSITLINPLFSNYYYDFLKTNMPLFKNSIPTVDGFNSGHVLKSLLKEEEEMLEFKFFRFLIFEEIDGKKTKIIGDIVLFDIDNINFISANIGYKLDKDFEGRGIITFFLSKIIPFAFESLGIHRLIAEILPENDKSLKIINKFKFLCEGISRKNLQIANKWRDHLRFSLIRNS